MSLSEYEEVKLLGRGSYGCVYCVRHCRTSKLLAMKQVIMVDMQNAEALEAKNEAKILQQVESPFIIRYIDSFLEDGMLNIVMELATHGNLNTFINNRKGVAISEKQIWMIFTQITLGLSFLHSMRVIHRDIKSLNILLGNNGRVMLGDLGVAILLSTSKNCAKSLVGTTYYLSPEQCEGQEYNSKSDIWALGCILYECMTASRPNPKDRVAFAGGNIGAIFMGILSGKYQPLPEYDESSDLVSVLRLCLSTDPRTRADTEQLLRVPAVEEYAKVAIEIYTTNDASETQRLIQNKPDQSSPRAQNQSPNQSSQGPEQQGSFDLELKTKSGPNQSEGRYSRQQSLSVQSPRRRGSISSQAAISAYTAKPLVKQSSKSPYEFLPKPKEAKSKSKTKSENSKAKDGDSPAAQPQLYSQRTMKKSIHRSITAPRALFEDEALENDSSWQPTSMESHVTDEGNLSIKSEDALAASGEQSLLLEDSSAELEKRDEGSTNTELQESDSNPKTAEKDDNVEKIVVREDDSQDEKPGIYAVLASTSIPKENRNRKCKSLDLKESKGGSQASQDSSTRDDTGDEVATDISTDDEASDLIEDINEDIEELESSQQRQSFLEDADEVATDSDVEDEIKEDGAENQDLLYDNDRWKSLSLRESKNSGKNLTKNSNSQEESPEQLAAQGDDISKKESDLATEYKAP